MDAWAEQIGSGGLAALAGGAAAAADRAAGAAELAELARALERRLGASRGEVRRLLGAAPSEWAAAEEAAQRARDAIERLERGADGLQAALGGGGAARAEAARAAAAAAQARLRQSDAVLRTLRRVAGLGAEARALDAAVRARDLGAAAEAAVALGAAVDAADDLGAARVRAALAAHVAAARTTISDYALAGLNALVDVDASAADSVRLRVPGGGGDGAALFAVLERLGSAEDARRALGARLVSQFVRPVLAARGAACAEAAGPAELVVRLGSDAGGAEPSAEAVVRMVELVDARLGGAAWAGDVLSEIARLVAERWLVRGAPHTRAELPAFGRVAGGLVALEERLMAGRGSEEAARPIRDAAGRLGRLFAERRAARALAHARALAEGASFAAHELAAHEALSEATVRALVGDAELAPDLEALGRAEAPPVFPRCAVSASAHALVAAAYGLANEAALAGDAGERAVLDGAAWQSLDVYAALFSAVHRAELRAAPALAWQHFNGCMYIAHHAAALGRGAPQWEAAARRLCAAGAATAADAEAAATRDLERMAAAGDYGSDGGGGGCDGLRRLAERLRRAVAQLSRATVPPAATPHVFYGALGRSLDAVFGATAAAVMGLRDIAADHSQTLSDHCRAVHAMVAMFALDPPLLAPYAHLAPARDAAAAPDPLLLPLLVDDGAPPADAAALAARYCPQAARLAQLADVLVISRADILARRRAGLLREFSADELAALIRALFSDTRDRARDIEELQRM
ncbi:hypothetical protein H4R18_004194 [Coemansia javaensis]|uniref:Centromere/kinetochore protein zw10 C-terminal domain-containing protein n=1 Tax=Coemansia javaensis TaxID=2761396 RepID=A0A9W8HD01_9FUNG|nr:hypothetical protein H4R18_004194 [Coemansia javaensis]